MLLAYIKNKVERGRWPLCKLDQIYPGDDGQIRTAEVLFSDKKEKIM